MKEKLNYIDVARGIAILLVVLGHAITKDIANRYLVLDYVRFIIYTIHMPIFFMISGILFQKNIDKYKKNSKFLYFKNKFHKFTIPYLLYSILIYSIFYIGLKVNFISNILISNNIVIKNIPNVIFSILTYINHVDHHLWFLYVMFLVILINRYVFFYSKSNKINILFSFFIGMFFYIIGIMFSNFLPEIIWKVCQYNFIFMIGRYAYLCSNKLKNIKIIISLGIISLLCLIMLCLIRFNQRDYLYIIIQLISQLGIALFIIYFISFRFFKNKILNFFGNTETSMALYLLHMPIILPLIYQICEKYIKNVYCNITLTYCFTIGFCIFSYKYFLSRFKFIKKYFFGISNETKEVNMKKTILFINSSLSDGGSERVMCMLANQFAKLGYKTRMILVREGRNDTYQISDNIELIRFNYKIKNKFYKLFSRIIKIRKELKKNPDCVISFMSDINLCTLIANFGINKKIIVSERGDPSQSTRSSFERYLEKKLYTKAYKVVLQTEYVKRYFSNEILEKTIVIPNPINDNLPKRNYTNINNTIVAAGRLTEQKNFQLLIDAFDDFHRINKNYNLIIYGNGPLKKELEQYINKLNLDDKVLLPGYVDNVDELMKDCWCYVSSSNYEGISNSMLESMAMGIPSICTDCPVGGARMVIENNKNGILVNVGDKNAITNSLIKLAKDKKFYDEISNNSLKITQKFGIDKIIDMWIDII